MHDLRLHCSHLRLWLLHVASVSCATELNIDWLLLYLLKAKLRTRCLLFFSKAILRSDGFFNVGATQSG